MNKNEVAFIICVNDEQQFAEACYYIQRLHVPEGYVTDIIAVREAESMTAGYQAAMESSDAKYKVYLHQDVMIINRNFLWDMMACFESNERIGLIGMIGCKELPLDALAGNSWDTGAIYHNCILYEKSGDRRILNQSENGMSVEVEAVDGLLLATQYDVPWRTDLFDGWHYYDISQCMEMRRMGYKVVIPYQEMPWCFHDNKSAEMNTYYYYAKRFAEEYQDVKNFEWREPSEEKLCYERAKIDARDELKHLVDAGEASRMVKLFGQPDFQGFLHLKEFEIIANIHRLETENHVLDLFWKPEDDFCSLNVKMREIRYALKRIVYDAVSEEKVELKVLENYSKEARFVICYFYGVNNAYIEQMIATSSITG